ncbi:MAG: 3-isopropylmalate dehydrogenase [Spirochaetaceae bacterium]|nr:3-isopropylmalate dehydrogenase [Spirochaetaceae bacterium]
MSYDVAVLSGDHIGPEVMKEGLKVLDAVALSEGFSFNYNEALVGGAAINALGSPLPADTLDLCLNSEAVYLGSVGGPEWDHLPPDDRPEVGGLLAARKALGLFANLRPVKLYPELVSSCPLNFKGKSPDVDILTVRELIGCVYFGEPKVLTEDEGLDTMIYRRHEVERILKVGFEAAANRGGRVCSVDKANVLRSSMLWRKTAENMRDNYPDIALSHMYVDNAAMQLILNPGQFDVIVTGNLFGDILSDESAALAGSLGMLPSASLGPSVHLFEPSGGSAPDIAGKGIANPLAQILSGAMMLEHSFGEHKAAKRIYNAVEKAIADGFRTGDITAPGEASISTAVMGDAVAERL